jgi:Co/Zn/Cd efflux system component
VFDLHLWRLEPSHLAAVISLITHNRRSPEHYRKKLSGLAGLSHLTIEVSQRPGDSH